MASANKVINSQGAKSDMIIVVVIAVICEGLFTSEVARYLYRSDGILFRGDVIIAAWMWDRFV